MTDTITVQELIKKSKIQRSVSFPALLYQEVMTICKAQGISFNKFMVSRIVEYVERING